MADDKLLELIDVLNKQLKKDRVTDADKKELDAIIKCLKGSEIPDYEIAANIADVSEFAIHVNNKVNTGCYYYESAAKQDEQLKEAYYFQCKQFMGEAIKGSQWLIQNAEVNISSVSNNHKYLLKKIIEKAIENIAKSKEYVMGIQIGNEHENAIDKIVSNLEAAETTLKGKVEELNKQFVDERTQEEKISESAESAEKVYNSYLLLCKLNELHVDELNKTTGKKKSLQEVISEAIKSGQQEVSITINEENYKVEITPEGKLKIKVLNQHTKPEVPGVKNVLEYTAKDIIGLWAKSEVSIEKDQSNNFAFAVGLNDKSRLLDLTIGGLGKKVPFSLRFANFYKVIEILRDESKPLKERFRLANNIATGSGKTGDIALLKFWAYLANIPCITTVPSDTLRNQSNKFDKEFLPSEVAMEFGEPFSEGNTRYATTTFDEAFNTQWDLLKRIYGENSKELALFLIDEAPKLKENAVLLARAIAIARNNPVAFFSATPDKFLNALFEIILQILLSPKERAALGIGKIPVVYYRYVPTPTLEESYHKKGKAVGYLPPEEAYIQKNENTHEKLNGHEDAVEKFKSAIKSHGKHPDLSQLSKPFLDFINQSLDSQAYKEGLIATEERWAREVTDAIIDNKKNGQERKAKRIDSFVKAIKDLNTGLAEKDIKSLVEQNLNVEVGGQSLPCIKLHNIIDTLNEYKKSGKAVDRDIVKQFIEDKYGIIDSDNLEFKSKLTNAILKLEEHKGYPEYASSIKRNYPGDKELYEHIFSTFPDIKKFCEQDAVVHYFNGSVKRFKSNGEEIYQYINDSDIKNILSMIKAGFVPNAISKELAIGIDAPRLSRVAAIIKDKTDILDPMFLLQLMGRGGRNTQVEGLCCFDMFTSDESYLKIDDITTLLGEKLLKRLEESYENYIKDEKSNIEGRSALLGWDIRKCITLCDMNSRFLERHGYSNTHDAIIDRVKNEFSYLNMQYCYDKKTVVRVFTNVLEQSLAQMEKNFNSFEKTLNNINQEKQKLIPIYDEGIEIKDKTIRELAESIKALKDLIKELKQQQSGIVPYSDNMSLEGWARYIVHVEPTSLENLVKADPNSNAPIFMEQKQISQNQDASAHNVGQSVNLPSTDTQQHQDASAHNVDQSVNLPSRTTPAPVTNAIRNKPIHKVSEPFMTGPTVPLEDTTNESPQRTSTKKKVMYGFIIASPFLAVGIYALVVGSAGFNPVTATIIFFGVAVIALASFVTVKKVCEKQSGSSMDTLPTANLSSTNLYNEDITHRI